ncbi:hypothetical protein [Magnetofaba australis]|uniref:Uncharacterized protein n=1 Tax=Magnetofaba australis IT-1 TaxID=1434232 RepID=A0A1Y2K9H2_9PROT|nr:hypothetical protein [Magnetofaba australis]OSM05952.1 hypothetical protein MAIT1_05146 [Magnetofaba australis IT-1]
MSNQIPSNITDDAYANEIEGGFRAMLVGHNTDGSHKANIDAAIGAIYAETAAVAYISTTQFTVAGDVTATYTVGRAINAVSSGGNVWSHVVSASFDGGSGLTTVTVSDEVIPADLEQILYGIITDERQLPEMGFLKTDGSEPSTGLQGFTGGIQCSAYKGYSATLSFSNDQDQQLLDLNRTTTILHGANLSVEDGGITVPTAGKGISAGGATIHNNPNGGHTDDPGYCPTLTLGDGPDDAPYGSWYGGEGSTHGLFIRCVRWAGATWWRGVIGSKRDSSRIEVFDMWTSPNWEFHAANGGSTEGFRFHSGSHGTYGE